MGLIKEPSNVDFKIKSKPWSEKELTEFSALIQEIKEKDSKRKFTYPLSKRSRKKSA